MGNRTGARAGRRADPRAGTRAPRWSGVGVVLVAALAACAPPETAAPPAPRAIPAAPGYEAVVERLSAFIEHELEDKELPAVSVALVDDQQTVWAAGFGEADPGAGVPADAATIYRVGSVSKLFTDMAVMQLVERDELDLDAPITDYIPEFTLGDPISPEVTADGPPTLRQLMSHRAGIVREPPVGHYFDDTGPSLAATVASLNGTPVIYEPGSRVKYSNAGIATVGYVLERTQGRPFTDYVRDAVLAPLGMRQSAFAPDEAIREGLAKAVMWGYDGREFPAPTFELGMAPAGSMYSPVTDLGRFMSAVFAGGSGAEGRVVADTTLAEMLSPQFGDDSGFGIGFGLGTLDGHRYAGHGGAIYGFATQLAMLPDEKLGAVAVTSRDVANTVTDRITDYALRLMLAARAGGPLPDVRTTGPIAPQLAADLPGTYRTADGGLEIRMLDRGASTGAGDVVAELGRVRYRMRAIADTLVIDGALGFGGFFRVEGDALVARDGTRLERVASFPGPRPEPAPDRFLDLIGEYGRDHNVLFIYEEDRALHALIEWIEIDRLEEAGPDRFAFPRQGGLYHGEHIEFERDASGRVTAAVAAGVRFARRPGAAGGETFTIDPVRPVAELREAALAASPPVETGEFRAPDLVELSALDPTIRYDIRYATTNNFMQSVFYEEPHAFMQRPAAEALVRAHRALAAQGFGLLIHDAYRPWYVTKMFFDATPESQKIFVADPANGSRHNRGAAVDLTLYDLATGEPIRMVGGYDEFSERSYPDYIGGTSLQRWHREVLRAAMEAEGFSVYEYEWWHFDYDDWASYPILDLTFDELVPGVDSP
ncbi:MAG: serine hydrolase [Gemmatimonadota bacterium]|nr:serine hydrolase [Gemmatimonadota bacterium]